MTDHMPYVADRAKDVPSADELRARIPGWGSDLDLADRPSVPKLSREAGSATGAHWVRPETQPGGEGRERSIEHAHVTPVFGTAQPLSGLAGVVKRYAYRRFSEGRLAHWMLLVVGDRLDVATHRVTDALRGRPDRDRRGDRHRGGAGGQGGARTCRLVATGLAARGARPRRDDVAVPADRWRRGVGGASRATLTSGGRGGAFRAW